MSRQGKAEGAAISQASSSEGERIASSVFQAVESGGGAMYIAAILSTAPNGMTVADRVEAMKAHMTKITLGLTGRQAPKT